MLIEHEHEDKAHWLYKNELKIVFWLKAAIEKEADSSKDAATKEIAEMLIKAKEMAAKEEAEEARLAKSDSESATSSTSTSETDTDKTNTSDAQPALDALKSEGAELNAEGRPSSSADSKEEDSVPETLKKSQQGLQQEAEVTFFCAACTFDLSLLFYWYNQTFRKTSLSYQFKYSNRLIIVPGLARTASMLPGKFLRNVVLHGISQAVGSFQGKFWQSLS